MADSLQTTYTNAFLKLKINLFDSIHRCVLLRVYFIRTIVDWADSLVPNIRQVITWTNDDPVHWRIYASADLNVFLGNSWKCSFNKHWDNLLLFSRHILYITFQSSTSIAGIVQIGIFSSENILQLSSMKYTFILYRPIFLTNAELCSTNGYHFAALCWSSLSYFTNSPMTRQGTPQNFAEVILLHLMCGFREIQHGPQFGRRDWCNHNFGHDPYCFMIFSKFEVSYHIF